MDAPAPAPGPGSELNALRRRAYGPHPDIQSDPEALARLAELEAGRTGSTSRAVDTTIAEPGAITTGARMNDAARARSEADELDKDARNVPAVASSEHRPRSRRQRLWSLINATRTRRNWFAAGTLAALFALAYTVGVLVGPRPDAVLYQRASGGDEVVYTMLDFLGADVDRSSIRGFEPFRGVEPWFAVNRQGLQCFMIIDRSGPMVDGANCVPPGVDLFADVGTLRVSSDDSSESLPDGSIIRFHYRGGSVDVVVYPASGAD